MSLLDTFEFLAKTPFVSKEIKDRCEESFVSLQARKSFEIGDQHSLRRELACSSTKKFADAVDVVAL